MKRYCKKFTKEEWSARIKKGWDKKDKESMQKFAKLKSIQTKRHYKQKSKAEKDEVSRKFSIGMKKYWENVSKEKKEAHIIKMSIGMKNKWEKDKSAFNGNIANINSHFNIIHAERINDYAGVITISDMETL